MTTTVVPIPPVVSPAPTGTVAPVQNTVQRAAEAVFGGDATRAPKAAPASPQPAQTVQQTLASVAKQIESYLRSIGRELEFRVDDSTGETIVTVRDAATGEVVRQIPNEETVRLARSLGNGPSALIDLLA